MRPSQGCHCDQTEGTGKGRGTRGEEGPDSGGSYSLTTNVRVCLLVAAHCPAGGHTAGQVGPRWEDWQRLVIRREEIKKVAQKGRN